MFIFLFCFSVFWFFSCKLMKWNWYPIKVDYAVLSCNFAKLHTGQILSNSDVKISYSFQARLTILLTQASPDAFICTLNIWLLMMNSHLLMLRAVWVWQCCHNEKDTGHFHIFNITLFYHAMHFVLFCLGRNISPLDHQGLLFNCMM